MRILIVGALVLASCSGNAGGDTEAEGKPLSSVASPNANADSAVASAASEQPTSTMTDTSADEAAVREVTRNLYASYNKPGGPDIKLSAAFDAAWKRAVGKDGGLDYDPFCQCQDFGDMRSKVRSLSIDGDRARVAVTFTNWGHASNIELGFAREAEGWRVDDVFQEGGKSLKAEMLAAEPGAMGIGN